MGPAALGLTITNLCFGARKVRVLRQDGGPRAGSGCGRPAGLGSASGQVRLEPAGAPVRTAQQPARVRVASDGEAGYGHTGDRGRRWQRGGSVSSACCARGWRTRQRMDGKALDRLLNDWVASRCAPGPGGGVAVDGKALRGARRTGGRREHVFAALLHGQGVVIAKGCIPHKTNEIPEFQPLLELLDLPRKA